MTGKNMSAKGCNSAGKVEISVITACAAIAGCMSVHEVGGRDFFGGGKPLVVNVSPGETLTAVRDRIRNMSAKDKAKGVEVRLAPGWYELGEPLLLEAADSGASRAPIVWRGAPGGRTVLAGGRSISARRFQPFPGNSNILVADVSDWDVKWPERPESECRDPYPIPELFIDGERQVIAGWPDWPTVAAPGDTNGGWAVVSSFVDKGSRFGSDGKYYDCNSHDDLFKMNTVESPWPGTFGYSGERPSRWLDAKDVVLHGFWTFDWAESKIPPRRIDTAARTITLAYPHEFGLRQGNPSPRRWRAMNLLEELDRPGEYFVDTEKSLVYIMPRRPLAVDAQVMITWADRSIIELCGVSKIAIADIELFGSWRHGIEAKEIANVAFVNLDIHGVRSLGLAIRKPQRCMVSACEIHDTGSGGIAVFDAGDRRTLTPARNVVEDCLIYGFSQNRLTSAHAIELSGCGNVMRHNEMFDAPHQAVRLQGNDNIFEYNIISNVLQSTDDAGAFYTGRDPSCRGNVIRYNHFADIGSDRGHGNAAIYFDDGDGGNEVYGCVFERSGAPGRGRFGTVFAHGGYSNVVSNCLFIDCRRPLGSAPWDQKKWEDFLKLPYMMKRLKEDVDIESPVYLARYPELKGYLPGQPDEIRWNSAYDNVFVNAQEVLRGRWATNETDVAVAELPPGDCNAACRALVPTFNPIPYEKIGRRADKGK